MMPRRRWAIGWPALTASPSLIEILFDAAGGGAADQAAADRLDRADKRPRLGDRVGTGRRHQHLGRRRSEACGALAGGPWAGLRRRSHAPANDGDATMQRAMQRSSIRMVDSAIFETFDLDFDDLLSRLPAAPRPLAGWPAPAPSSFLSWASWAGVMPRVARARTRLATATIFVQTGLAAGVGWIELAAAVVLVAVAANPAVALHAVENADERRRLDPHPLGQVGLRQPAFERQAAEHLRLAVGHALRRELFVERPLQGVRRLADPETDAVFKVVFEHGGGLRIG